MTPITKFLFTSVFLCASASSYAQICTREYAPICGQVTGETSPKTFGNRCLLLAAQATPVHDGECAAAVTPPPQPVGGAVDAQGCRPSAGYVWNTELASCIRPWMTSAITLQVARQRQKCTGLVEMQCLMVREIEPGQKRPPFTPLFANISGYTHKKGQATTLRVRKDRIENPPADTPDTTYNLLKIMR